ncbi:MAG TPA: glycine/sarcosine/betaine reductase selenoprotein B family protein [Terriglobia bacterium]|nr:glycine/sarcosine/betaine reductase selenoprotein B family protein [Terriglobia bacterium]
MPRIEDLSDVQRHAVLNFACFEYDSSPFVPLREPLQNVRLALVTTAGLHCRGDRPFSPGDQSYRAIPAHAPDRDILQSHNSIGFDRTAIYRDLNVTFPRDRLLELVQQGVIASRTSNDYSFMGAQTNPKRILEETGPEVARLLLEDGAGAAILTPT